MYLRKEAGFPNSTERACSSNSLCAFKHKKGIREESWERCRLGCPGGAGGGGGCTLTVWPVGAWKTARFQCVYTEPLK